VQKRREEASVLGEEEEDEMHGMKIPTLYILSNLIVHVRKHGFHRCMVMDYVPFWFDLYVFIFFESVLLLH